MSTFSLFGSGDSRSRIDRLWNDYKEYESRDLPEKSAETLLKIQESARKEGLHYDFFKAWEEYVKVMSRRNWKLRDELTSEKEQAFRELGNPVVLYSAGLAPDFPAFVEEWESSLKNGRNEDFWHKRPVGLKGEVVANHISNDLEYVILSQIFSHRADSASCRAYLKAHPDNYPVSALVEYSSIEDQTAYDSLRTEKLIKAYRDFARKYEGKAVGTMAGIRECALMFEMMNSGKKGRFVKENAINGKSWTSEDYLRLSSRCKELCEEKDRFRDEEKQLLENENGAEKLIGQLKGSAVYAQINGDKVKIGLRNLGNVKMTVHEGNTDKGPAVFSRTFENPTRSFYVIDTLRTSLPALADGEYTAVFESGKCREKFNLRRHSLAVTLDKTADGWLMYLAERMTGKPVEEAEIEIFDRKDKSLIKKSLSFNGPTLLTGELAEAIEGGARQIVASCVDEDGLMLSSDRFSVNKYSETDYDNQDSWQALLLTDRSAYRPGETLEFKSIIYKDYRNGKMNTAPEGLQVQAVVRDAQDNNVSSIFLTTNDFGSVAGRIQLPRDHRAGTWKLAIFINGQTLNAKWFTVDEFKLPDYSIDFTHDGVKYFPGDKVPVRGKITSYAGNSLEGLGLEYEISSWRGNPVKGVPQMDREGNFIFYIESAKTGQSHYTLSLRLTDAAGQTIEKQAWLTVGRDFSIDCALEGLAEGEFCRNEKDGYRWDDPEQLILKEDEIVFTPSLRDIDGAPLEGQIEWQLLKGKEVLDSGLCESGKSTSLSLKAHPSGLYLLKLHKEYVFRDGNGKEVRSASTRKLELLKLSEQDECLYCRLDNAYKVVEKDNGIGIIFGSSSPVWANAIVVDLDGHILDILSFKLEGTKGNNLKKLMWTFKEGWTDRIMVKMDYIRNGECHSFSHQFTRKADSFRLPLSIKRFSDSLLPGVEYCLEFKSTAQAELAAAIFDKSTEDIAPNRWNEIFPSIRGIYLCGTTSDGCDFRADNFYRGIMPFQLMGSRAEFMEDAEMAPSSAAMNRSPKESGPADMEIRIRDDFRSTAVFEPHIYTAEDGTAELRFTAPDRLSTYVVSVFAHDKAFHNRSLREEFVVSQPVSITVHEPSLLYGADLWHFRPTLSNNTDKTVKGILDITVYDGESAALLSKSFPVELSSMGIHTPDLQMNIPAAESLSSFSNGKASLKIKAVFISESASDGIAVRIPVLPDKQEVTETHSALLSKGGDRAQLEKRLRAEFINFSGESATARERSLADLLDEVMSGKTEIKSDNLLDLSEVLCVRHLTGQGDWKEAWEKILKCRCSDGGFAWFPDFNSSPVLTAVVLERLAGLRKAGLEDQSIEAIFPDAVAYLDRSFFSQAPGLFWNLSVGQYFRVRSFFPEIAVDSKLIKENKEAAKAVREYACAKSGKDILKGHILEKARRAAALMENCAGNAFTTSLGLGRLKMEKLLSADIASLKEYAVEHSGGGCYYPNAVMPFRAMLESEAYAHSIVCDLMDNWNAYLEGKGKRDERAAEIADGLRLWLMIQKDNQKWESGFEYVNAVLSVRRGSEEMLGTSILSLSATSYLPLREIKAAGNGFSISTETLMMTEEGKYRPLREGEVLKVGDKLTIRYKVHSDENRSLVHLRLPYSACLRPVRQFSGHYGCGLREWRINPALQGCAAWWVGAQAYREVHEDALDYWFEVFPEEDRDIEEEFFVSQAGVFTAQVTTIESLYAPDYRANGAFSGKLQTESKQKSSERHTHTD